MSDKLRLDIPILLPGVDDAADACVARLISEMRGRDGIEEVHVSAHDGEPTQLCVHYDAAILPLTRIRELVSAAGARVAQRYGHAVWQLDIRIGGVRALLPNDWRGVPGSRGGSQRLRICARRIRSIRHL